MSGTAILVLAAGAAARFGAPKLREEIDGTSILAGRVAVAEEVAPGNVHVVLAADDAWARDCLRGVHVVINERAAEGLGTSVAAGVRSLPGGTDAVLILPADQVAVTAADLTTLLAAHPNSAAGIACALYDGTRGAPAVFSRSWFGRLAALTADRGAKELLAAAGVRLVELPNAAIDIDTRADLDAYRSLRAAR